MIVLEQLQSSKNDDLLALENVVSSLEDIDGSRDIHTNTGGGVFYNGSRVGGIEWCSSEVGVEEAFAVGDMDGRNVGADGKFFDEAAVVGLDGCGQGVDAVVDAFDVGDECLSSDDVASL